MTTPHARHLAEMRATRDSAPSEPIAALDAVPCRALTAEEIARGRRGTGGRDDRGTAVIACTCGSAASHAIAALRASTGAWHCRHEWAAS